MGTLRGHQLGKLWAYPSRPQISKADTHRSAVYVRYWPTFPIACCGATGRRRPTAAEEWGSFRSIAAALAGNLLGRRCLESRLGIALMHRRIRPTAAMGVRLLQTRPSRTSCHSTHAFKGQSAPERSFGNEISRTRPTLRLHLRSCGGRLPPRLRTERNRHMQFIGARLGPVRTRRVVGGRRLLRPRSPLMPLRYLIVVKWRFVALW